MNKNTSNSFSQGNLDYFFIWIIGLCSVRFFTLFIPVTAAKAASLGGALIVLGLLVVYTVYGSGSATRKQFTAPIILIFLALIISAFAATFFHNQTLSETLFASMDFLFFLSYFLYHRMKPDPDKLISMFLWIGYAYAFIYLIQSLVYPVQLVSSRIILDRGTARIAMPGIEYMFASWFIQLSRFFITKKGKYLIAMIPLLIVIILLAARQLLAATVFLTILNILLSRKLKSKAFMIILISLSVIPFYFLFQGIFEEIFSISKKGQGVQDNIRLFTSHYFLFDFNKNPLWMLTGNGMPSQHSEYGIFLSRISESMGYYMSDIGVIGDFSKFGILFTLAELFYLIKISITRFNERFTFARYVALSMMITMFSGSGLIASTIAHLSFIFYIVDINKKIDQS